MDFVDWEKCNGLVPAITQNYRNSKVLMLGFMNKEALKLTLDTKIVHYYSRTKKRIWKKGESSLNIQKLKSISLDCDNDTLLLKVEQEGFTCHTGKQTCFFKDIKGNDFDISNDIHNILDRLALNIKNRIESKNENSYTYSLIRKGENTILKKIMEESAEFCFALKDGSRDEILNEFADLIYHSLVALTYNNLSFDEVKEVLCDREGISGLIEKKLRKNV